MNKIILSIGLSSLVASMLLANQADDAKIQQLLKDVKALNAMKADLEGNARSGFQLAGYASFDWTGGSGGSDDFSGVKFAPIFHYQYGTIFQFEGELEFEIDEKGETVTALEYAAGTIFLNDYMGLQIGQFMSPIGQFVQNLHPSWINKLPSTPVGFGHDGAAPTSNIGMALRGGLPKIANLRSNYVVFVANAPRFGFAADGDTIIDATGKSSSGGASQLLGARYALNPIGGMEIGISGATGEAFDDTNTSGTSQNIFRTYSAMGADFMYNDQGLDVKAEYIQQKVGDNVSSTLEGGTWTAFYAQVAYQINGLNIEPVLRYSDYENPENRKKQIAVGLNYLFANNLIAKLAYENDTNSNIDDVSRVRAQLAFGF
ncbi:hypothetical protein JHD47_07745 [Sulfurimonas sp. SAG-AH-194-L11]|nr:hypothetical protein [Sulfurimonas sp. SAG-AH-194-L11]MDF1877706.1 hypothetical protein [Sulfurimonas sp. SAG-AH-194-L11]